MTVRKAVRWGFVALLPGELVIVLCLAAGVAIPPPGRTAVELTTLALFLTAGTLLALDCRRHRAAGLARKEALLAGIADTVPAAVIKLTVHEVSLSTSFARWVARRGPHGVRDGDVTVKYTGGQAMVIFGFLFVSVVETVALFFLLVKWPVVHVMITVLDVWGLYFIVALHASCVVRPHVVGADGSLRLRYGALLDIRVPADRIASVRRDMRFPDGKLAAVGADGIADLAVAGQTSITVEFTEPVSFVRALGKRDQANGFRFYADDPSAALAALSAGSKRTGDTPGSAAVSRTRSR